MTRSTRRQFAKALAAAGVLLPAAELFAQTAGTETLKKEFTHLTDADLAALAKQLQERGAQIETLRKFQLKNSDEPDVTFSAGTRRW